MPSKALCADLFSFFLSRLTCVTFQEQTFVELLAICILVISSFFKDNL